MRIDVKLKSKRGASITFAIVIFLLCAVAGASVFMMATSNAGRYTHPDEREYFVVSSSALLMVDMLDGATYNSKGVQYDYIHSWESTGGSGRTETDEYQLTLPDTNTETGKGKITGGKVDELKSLNIIEKIRKQCDLLVPAVSVPDVWYKTLNPAQVKLDVPATFTHKFTMTVTGNDNSKSDTVGCTLVMNANYDLIFTFAGENGEYVMTLYWEASTSVTYDKDPEFNYTEVTDGNYVTGSNTIRQTLNVSVSWVKNKVTISRGEANEAA